MNDAEKNLSFLPHIREFLRSFKMNTNKGYYSSLVLYAAELPS